MLIQDDQGDIGMGYAQPPDSPLGTRPTSRESMRLPRWPWAFDMIFAARQLHEKCQEQYDDLSITFIDLTKAFDAICRDRLWLIMEKFGCPRKFTALVRQLHDGMRATVLDISSHKRSETGLCSRPYPLQHGIRCPVSRRFTR